MGVWNSHTSLGNILGALVAGAFANSNWGMAFVLPGILTAAVGCLLYLFLLPDPSVVGLTIPRSNRNTNSPTSSSSPSSFSLPKTLPKSASASRLTDLTDASDSDSSCLLNQESQGKAIGFCGALRIPGVVEFSLCLFFAKLVSYTFLFWLPNYISTNSGLDARSSATLSTFFDVGGIMGGIIAGLVSDHSGMAASTCGLMLVLAIPVMCLYQVMAGAWC